MQLEKFERNIFFKVSRSLTFIVGALAVISLVISILILLYAISPTSKASEPQPPAMSKEVSITPDAIKAELAQMAQKASETTTFPGVQKPSTTENIKPSAVATTPVSPQKTAKQQLEEKAKEIQALFPAKLYPWENVYRTVCVQPSYYGCLQTRQKIIRYGVAGRIESVLRYYKNIEDMLPVLDELKALVSSYPVEQRGDVLTAWVNLKTKAEKARQASFKEAEKEYREAIKAQHESYITSIERKTALKPTSLMILGISFALIWQVGLILAILGIERNTRLLEEFIKASSKQ